MSKAPAKKTAKASEDTPYLIRDIPDGMFDVVVVKDGVEDLIGPLPNEQKETVKSVLDLCFAAANALTLVATMSDQLRSIAIEYLPYMMGEFSQKFRLGQHSLPKAVWALLTGGSEAWYEHLGERDSVVPLGWRLKLLRVVSSAGLWYHNDGRSIMARPYDGEPTVLFKALIDEIQKEEADIEAEEAALTAAAKPEGDQA